jgi:hypothetical protein
MKSFKLIEIETVFWRAINHVIRSNNKSVNWENIRK